MNVNLMQMLLMKMPGFISCKELDEKLDDYLEGDLSSWNRFRFAWHFIACKACAVYAAGYRKTVALIKSSIDSPNHPAADEEVPEELLQDIIKKQTAPNPDS
ncbi:zf-HC2 domain-containing protein [bacterium AH-315-P15]|nr:zf-HC2 domain-containing protein [bacterium AH-315-P15]